MITHLVWCKVQLVIINQIITKNTKKKAQEVIEVLIRENANHVEYLKCALEYILYAPPIHQDPKDIFKKLLNQLSNVGEPLALDMAKDTSGEYDDFTSMLNRLDVERIHLLQELLNLFINREHEES